MKEETHDTLSEWQFAIACLRAEVEAGRKLTPAEMIAAVDFFTPEPRKSLKGINHADR